jgi:hypothetical protein
VSKRFFFEKKKQKTFSGLGLGRCDVPYQRGIHDVPAA